MSTHRLPVVGGLIILAAATQAATPDRIPVEDARPLLIAAIDAPSGQAHGVLVGQTAEAITKHFQSTAPITIDVTTEKRFRQAGCSRLKVLFAQEGVLLPGKSAPERRTIEFGINYCRDGLPPRQT